MSKTTICTAILLLLSICAAAQPKPKPPKDIQIGTLQFIGTTDPNCGDFCGTGYEFLIDASTLTGDVLAFGDFVMCIGTICQHFSVPAQPGPWITPIDGLFAAHDAGDPDAILPDCARIPCRSIDLQLVSTTAQPFSFVLLDGTTFTTYAVNTTTMKALPGQHVVKPGQSVPIMLELDKRAK